MSDESRTALTLPENLTHCCECGREFSEPVTWWNDYFEHIDEAAFSCTPCGERMGYVDAE